MEAATEALGSMGQSRADFVLVFASTRFDQEALLKGVTSVTGDTPLSGCSSAGEILTQGPSRRSVVVMTIRSDTLKVATGLGLGVNEDSRQAGQEASYQVAKTKLPSPAGFLMFPDGLMGNPADIIRGIQEVLGLSFPIVGGSAADDFGFNRTYQ